MHACGSIQDDDDDDDDDDEANASAHQLFIICLVSLIPKLDETRRRESNAIQTFVCLM